MRVPDLLVSLVLVLSRAVVGVQGVVILIDVPIELGHTRVLLVTTVLSRSLHVLHVVVSFSPVTSDALPHLERLLVASEGGAGLILTLLLVFHLDRVLESGEHSLLLLLELADLLLAFISFFEFLFSFFVVAVLDSAEESKLFLLLLLKDALLLFLDLHSLLDLFFLDVLADLAELDLVFLLPLDVFILLDGHAEGLLLSQLRLRLVVFFSHPFDELLLLLLDFLFL